jgi:hypothetical protein
MSYVYTSPQPLWFHEGKGPKGFFYQQLLPIMLLPDLGLLIKLYVADDPSTFYHF